MAITFTGSGRIDPRTMWFGLSSIAGISLELVRYWRTTAEGERSSVDLLALHLVA